jgi:uncharacterized repeat protein (TIGR01451 family)
MTRRRLFATLLLLTLALASLPPRTPVRADDYTVTNTDDAGPGSLRQAIIDANDRPGPDIIQFNIAGCGGVCTIEPLTPLPILTDDGTTIDGYTQPGSAPASPTAPATLLIEIGGALTAPAPGAFRNGLTITSTGNLIQGLVINHFALNGIAIAGPEATGNVISGNYIGTDSSGTMDVGNGTDGVFIALGAADNRVGGYTPAERNLLSGNEWEGVGIHGAGTTRNTIAGNGIGTDATGAGDLGNTLFGVRIYGGAHDNTVGGSTSGAGNLISGNDGDGVRIAGAGSDGNVVAGNLIGTDGDGTAALLNGEDGVGIRDGARYNLVGGVGAGARNIISGNTSGDGVEIQGTGTMSNTVSGNHIGTDVSGSVDLGNRYFGVYLSEGAAQNVVGGTTPGARNLISGNDDCGVALYGLGTDENLILGNFIGTDADGVADLGNRYDGVYIVEGPKRNRIGGGTPAERNVISGNDRSGVYVTDEGTDGNVISGNYIGTDASGTLALGNTYHAIGVFSDALHTVIGGDTPAAGNVLAASTGYGIIIGNPGTAYTTVANNLIGTDASGTLPLPNTDGGIDMYNSTHDNVIGPGNVIGGNGGHGIEAGSGSASRHTIFGNYIGVDRGGTIPLGNAGDGVHISFSSEITVGPGNVIAYNAENGVVVFDDASVQNVITQNSIFGNLMGIDLQRDANGGILAPEITGHSLSPVSVSGNACPGCTVEVFGSSDADGEGELYLGAGTADGGGAFDIPLSALGRPHLTATATDPADGTSEFSTVYTVPVPDLSTSTKVVSPTAASIGQVLAYNITLSNTGTADASALLTDTLSSHLIWDGCTASSGTCEWAATENRMTWSGAVPADGPVHIQYQAAVDFLVPDGTVISNTATVAFEGGNLIEVGPATVTVHAETLYLPLVIKGD